MQTRNKYNTDPKYWQTHRNTQIARELGVNESSVSRKRKSLIKKFGPQFECKVLGWYYWERVNWHLTDEEIYKTWSLTSKRPTIKTIQKKRLEFS